MGEIEISDEDMPVLFRSADSASAAAQRNFIWCMTFDLSLIVLASVVGSLSFSSENFKASLAVLSAAFMGAGLLLIALPRFTAPVYSRSAKMS